MLAKKNKLIILFIIFLSSQQMSAAKTKAFSVLSGSDKFPQEGLVLHLDAENYSVNGTAVWNDSSVKKHKITQTDKYKIPEKVDKVLNGHPVVRFSGKEYLSGPPVLKEGDKSFTFIAVWKRNSWKGHGQVIFEQADRGRGKRASLLTVDRKYGFNGEHNDAHSIISYKEAVFNISIMTVKPDGTVTIYHKDNSKDIVKTATINAKIQNTGASKLFVGAKTVNKSEKLIGDIAEIIIYDRVITGEEAAKIRKSLSGKYHITEYNIKDSSKSEEPYFAAADGIKNYSKHELLTMCTHARELRYLLQNDRYRPKYHFVPPESGWNDINGTVFWKGRYHVFYLARTLDPELTKKLEKIPGQKSNAPIWGHASSIDLLHWVHHPFALIPAFDGSMPKGIFSGDMMTNMDIPTIIAHIPGQGTCIWQAQDDMLINWKPLPQNPVISQSNPPSEEIKVFDPAGWKEGDSYYALIGNASGAKGYEGDSSSLVKSDDLIDWEYIGPFYKSRREWTTKFHDAACIDFFPLEDKYMLVTHVHNPYYTVQWYLGEYEPGKRFIPEQHGLLSTIHAQVAAPETMIDDKGRRIFMAWNTGGKSVWERGWKSMSTLPRVFSLSDEGRLEQRPIEELKKLRHNHRSAKSVTIKSGQNHRLNNIGGTCVEISLLVESGDYDTVGLKILQSPDGSEETVIGYDRLNSELFIDFSKSTKGGYSCIKYRPWFIEKNNAYEQEKVTRQSLPLELSGNEDLELRFFIDGCIVEVFANNRQVLVQNVYPELPSSTGVSLFSEGGIAEFSRIEAWDMHWSNAF